VLVCEMCAGNADMWRGEGEESSFMGKMLEGGEGRVAEGMNTQPLCSHNQKGKEKVFIINAFIFQVASPCNVCSLFPPIYAKSAELRTVVSSRECSVT